MQRKLIMMLFACSATFAISANAAYTGIVTVDEVNAAPGAKITVGVRLASSNEQVAGMEIPLKFTGPFTVDSVGYDGSLISNQFLRIIHIDNNADSVILNFLPDWTQPTLATVSATSGLLATLFITVDPAAPAGFNKIDSILQGQVFGTVTLWKRIQFSDKDGSHTLLPGFDPGGITVQVPTGINDDNSILPTEFSLSQNYPNPFNPTTEIEFALPASSQVKVEVFNVLGQSVAVLADKRFDAGVHQVTFDADGRPSGVYFYRVSHSGGVETRKMLLLK